MRERECARVQDGLKEQIIRNIQRVTYNDHVEYPWIYSVNYDMMKG